MTATSTLQFGPEFVKELVPWMIQAIGEATARAFRMFWDIGMIYLSEHWVAVIVGLVVVFVIAFIRAIVTGRWAMLGSVVYNYLYVGSLFLVGLIWGPEVFANDYFKIVLVVLYFACFIATGLFLHKVGVRRIR